MWSAPEVARYTIGSPSSEQRNWMRVPTYLGHWQLLGFGYWAVEDRATGLYVGELGFADFRREIEDNNASLHVAEKLGYHEVTRTSYEGKPTILFERHRSAPSH